MPVTVFQVVLIHEDIAIKYHFTSGFTFLVSGFHIPTGVDNLTMVLLKNITPDKIFLVVIRSHNGITSHHIYFIVRHRFCLDFHHGRSEFSSRQITTHINNRHLDCAFIKLLINQLHRKTSLLKNVFITFFQMKGKVGISMLTLGGETIVSERAFATFNNIIIHKIFVSMVKAMVFNNAEIIRSELISLSAFISGRVAN